MKIYSKFSLTIVLMGSSFFIDPAIAIPGLSARPDFFEKGRR